MSAQLAFAARLIKFSLFVFVLSLSLLFLYISYLVGFIALYVLRVLPLFLQFVVID